MHNDLKLDNCQFDPADPDRVRSIFDWDMTTLGEPLVDLGTLLNYWPDPSDGTENTRVRHEGLASMGLPTRREVTDRYAERTGLDVSSAGWYEAFAQWKTGVVVQQLYRRWERGESSDPRMETIADRLPVLAATASQLLDAALNHRYLVAATTLQVNGVTRLPSGRVHGAMMPTDSSRSCWYASALMRSTSGVLSTSVRTAASTDGAAYVPVTERPAVTVSPAEATSAVSSSRSPHTK